MKKRGSGGRGALGFSLCCYYILHFLSIRLFVIGHVLPQSVASQKNPTIEVATAWSTRNPRGARPAPALESRTYSMDRVFLAYSQIRIKLFLSSRAVQLSVLRTSEQNMLPSAS